MDIKIRNTYIKWLQIFDKHATICISNEDSNLLTNIWSNVIKDRELQLNIKSDNIRIVKKNKMNFPNILLFWYSHIGVNRCFLLGTWTFLSFEYILKHKKDYNHFICVAISYVGIDYMKMLCISNKSKQFFVRIVNSSEKLENENQDKYTNYIPDDKNLDMYNFDDVIDHIINDSI